MTMLDAELSNFFNTTAFPTRFTRSHQNSGASYPPYNIIRTSDAETVLEMALAGFAEDEIDVVVEDRHLKVSGAKQTGHGSDVYLYRGIGTRSFERTFALSRESEVTGAEYNDGILSVTVTYKPVDEKKPTKIPIKRTAKTLLTED